MLLLVRVSHSTHTQPRHADISDNDGGVHAWDEGWAFYTGSLEGTDVGGSADGGQMVYALAEKRCENFGTCDTAGVSEVNNELLTLWETGRDHLAAFECVAAENVKDDIVPLMAVPLIQGVLRCVWGFLLPVLFVALAFVRAQRVRDTRTIAGF